MNKTELASHLRNIFGDFNVITDSQGLEELSFDKCPINLIKKDPGSVALLTVRPDSNSYHSQLQLLLRLVKDYDLKIVIRGGGSGVCGAGVPRYGNQTIIVDMTSLDEINFSGEKGSKNSVIAGAGIIGSKLEKYLNSQGYTLGHSPASLGISTPGGWVATRSSGQFSSRYGNIEDLIEGVEFIGSNPTPNSFSKNNVQHDK